MIPVILFALLVGQISISLIWAQLRAYRLSGFSWEQLEARFQAVGLEGIQIAATTPALSTTQNGLGSDDLWDLLGGSVGLRRLENNARIMVALAGYMERQNNLQNMILAERMRLDGAALRKTIRSIRLTRYIALQTKVLHSQLHEAAKVYTAMRSRLPALHEMTHGVLYLEPLAT